MWDCCDIKDSSQKPDGRYAVSVHIYMFKQTQSLGFSPTWAEFSEIIDAKRAVIPTLFQ